MTDVLVVDDAPLVAASLAHALTAAGHRPRVATPSGAPAMSRTTA